MKLTNMQASKEEIEKSNEINTITAMQVKNRAPLELWKEQLKQGILTQKQYDVLIHLTEYKTREPDKLREYFEKEVK